MLPLVRMNTRDRETIGAAYLSRIANLEEAGPAVEN